MLIATAMAVALLAYLAIGLVVALWFIVLGVSRIDPVARGSGVLFRVLLLPGGAMLWPWVVARALRAREKRA